jgi:hypothetical protein
MIRTTQGGIRMATVVLVHGAWHGSWCWARARRSGPSANADGESWRVAPIPAAAFNVNLADRAWVDAQCTSQPLATFQQKVTVHNALPPEKVTHVLATGYEQTPFRPFHELAKRKGWQTLTIDCGHEVMLDRPGDLVAMLEAAAR